jgi:hypothetical protein
MLPIVPLGPRARVAAALAAAGACVVAAIAGIAACLTAPPADISTSTNERPLIIHTSVQPPEGLLDGWPPPGTPFLVPVLLPDPNAACSWRLFDTDTESQDGPRYKGEFPCLTSVLDGGVVVEDVHIDQPADGHCHIFTFIVAHGFSPGQLEAPDSIGGDSLTWDYEPPGALCNFYDAGAFQDGAFPMVDAAKDALPITPESGPIPESGVDP